MLAKLQGMSWGGILVEELLWAGAVSLPMPGKLSDQAGSQAGKGMAALLGGCWETAGRFVHLVNTAYSFTFKSLFVWLCWVLVALHGVFDLR